MSTLLLFGAGASYGNPDCNPYPPPLGPNLFNALHKRGGTAASVNGDLAELFRSDFEAAMLRFYEERPGEVPDLLREMAIYFTEFSPGRDNFYRKVVRWVIEARAQTVIATTNYDLLIETAISEAGKFICYTADAVPSNNLALLKIHGSCNFLPDVPPRQITQLRVIVPEGSSIFAAPVRPATSVKEIVRYCRAADVLAPAIACYMRGKPTLFCRDFVLLQQAEFAEQAKRAQRIIVIGLRPVAQDTHIWQPLSRSRARLGYVGLPKDAEAFETWVRGEGRRQAFVMASTFEEALPLIRIALNR